MAVNLVRLKNDVGGPFMYAVWLEATYGWKPLCNLPESRRGLCNKFSSLFLPLCLLWVYGRLGMNVLQWWLQPGSVCTCPEGQSCSEKTKR